MAILTETIIVQFPVSRCWLTVRRINMCTEQTLYASNRISMKLFSSAQNAANGAIDENKTT